MNGININNSDGRGLFPFPVILAATKGDPDAMKIVLQHYASYIAYLSTRKVRDKYGNVYYGIDEDMCERPLSVPHVQSTPCTLTKKAAQYRANQIRSFCAEPRGGCAMTLSGGNFPPGSRASNTDAGKQVQQPVGDDVQNI